MQLWVSEFEQDAVAGEVLKITVGTTEEIEESNPMLLKA